MRTFKKNEVHVDPGDILEVKWLDYTFTVDANEGCMYLKLPDGVMGEIEILPVWDLEMDKIESTQFGLPPGVEVEVDEIPGPPKRQVFDIKEI